MDNMNQQAHPDLSLLEKDVEGLWKRTVPGPTVLYAREGLIQRLQTIIEDRYGEQYTVVSFGSTSYGISSVTSDLDLAVIDGFRPDGFSPDVDMEQLPPIYNPNNLAKTLASRGMRDVQPIRAVVPIVKFVDSRTGIQCDININEQFGIRNSRLLRAYLDLTPIGRPLALVLKTWAKQREINDPAGNNGPTTLSSYSLILLLIAYLQHVGHLPNLQDPDVVAAAGVPASHLWQRPVMPRGPKQKKKAKSTRVQPSTVVGDGVAATSPPKLDLSDALPPSRSELGSPTVATLQPESQVPALVSDSVPVTLPRLVCDTTFASDVSECVGWTQTPLELGSALVGFFAYYAHDFNYETSVVDIARGGVVTRDTSFVEPPPLVKEKPKKPRRKRAKDNKQADEVADAAAARTTDEAALTGANPVTNADQTSTLPSEHTQEPTIVEQPTIPTSTTDPKPSPDNAEDSCTRVSPPDANTDYETRMADSERDESSNNGEETAPEPVIAQTEDADDESTIGDDREDSTDTATPEQWKEHLLITQDPFIRARNTSQNIRPATMRGIIKELERAHNLLLSGASLDELCLHQEGPTVGEGPPRRRKARQLNPTRPVAPIVSHVESAGRTRDSNRSTKGRAPQAATRQLMLPLERRGSSMTRDASTSLASESNRSVTEDKVPRINVADAPPSIPPQPLSVERPLPTPQELLRVLQIGALTRARQQAALSPDSAVYPPGVGVGDSGEVNSGTDNKDPAMVPNMNDSKVPKELTPKAIPKSGGDVKQLGKKMTITSIREVEGITSPRCVVKGIRQVPEAELRSILTDRFGLLSDLVLIDGGRIAFVEFEDVAAARRAIAACLSDTTNRGIWIDLDKGTRVSIRIEPQYSKSTRPPRPIRSKPSNT